MGKKLVTEIIRIQEHLPTIAIYRPQKNRYEKIKIYEVYYKTKKLKKVFHIQADDELDAYRKFMKKK